MTRIEGFRLMLICFGVVSVILLLLAGLAGIPDKVSVYRSHLVFVVAVLYIGSVLEKIANKKSKNEA